MTNPTIAMTSSVLELQHEAMDPGVRVDDLVRKAVEVATELGIDDFRVWATHELQGYPGHTTPPAYRQVTGVLRAYHPTRGWIPITLPDKDLQKKLESRAAGESISEIENLYHDPHKLDMVELGPAEESLTLDDLMQMVPYSWVLRIFGDTREYQPGTVPTLLVSKPTIKAILDSVRNEVIRWSRALESRPVPGKD